MEVVALASLLALFVTTLALVWVLWTEVRASQFNVRPSLFEPKTSPEAYYKQAFDLIKRHSLYAQNVNFDEWEHKFAGKLTSYNAASQAISALIEQTQDRYGRLLDANQYSQAVRSAYQRMLVQCRLHPDGVGYLRLTTFASHYTGTEFQRHLRCLHNAHSIILDLRGNRGGHVAAALQVLSALLRPGRLVEFRKGDGEKSLVKEYVLTDSIIEGRSGEKVLERIERLPYLLNDRPLVILVDDQSASASELVSGVLQEYGVAFIVGSKTFGKGIAQTYLRLPMKTALYLTDSSFHQPSGHCIHGEGITPNRLLKVGDIGNAATRAAILEEFVQYQLAAGVAQKD